MISAADQTFSSAGISIDRCGEHWRISTKKGFDKRGISRRGRKMHQVEQLGGVKVR